MYLSLFSGKDGRIESGNINHHGGKAADERCQRKEKEAVDRNEPRYAYSSLEDHRGWIGHRVGPGWVARSQCVLPRHVKGFFAVLCGGGGGTSHVCKV